MNDKDMALATRRATLLHAAAKVARNVTSILNPERLLDETVDVICEEFGFYYAGVFLLDKSRRWMVLHAGYGVAGRKMLAQEHKLRVNGHSMIGRASGEQHALIALDVGEEPVHFKNPILPKTRSEMALPLIVGTELIGALTVQSTREAAFSTEDIMVLQGMADQLAIAIQNAELHREHQQLLAQAERQAHLLKAASKVGKEVTVILSIDTLLREVSDVICEEYGFYYAGVFLLDQAGEWAVLRAGHGAAGAQMLANHHQLKVGGLSMIGSSISQRKGRIALDVGEEPVHFKNPLLPYTRSEMALPLLVSGRPIGALTVQSREESAFSKEDITSLQTMADQLAVAIENARLLQELKAAHKELVRTKTFEALATSTIEAIHWIGNKALPITSTIKRLHEDVQALASPDEEMLASMLEDLDIIAENAGLILAVKEHLIGPAREQLPQPVIVADVFKDVITAAAVPAAQISCQGGADLPLVIADSSRLSRAFDYLLKNALEATAELEQIKIQVEIEPAEEEQLIIRVKDNGPGFSQENLDQVWAAFYSTKPGHAGLGLSATLQIIRQLDGKVTAFNAEAGGAVVEVRIPYTTEKPPAAELPTAKKILILDDEDLWSNFAQAKLVEAGNEVARTGELPAQLAEFDLILLDDCLVNGDVTQLLKALRKSGVTDKVVVLASSLSTERATALMGYAVYDVRLKPYTEAGLAELML
ncbi:MAG TPA: GAF domain-containing protein [Thermoflexia bacterium]|nr:GAF domain-containing protein [Thermoflexia bacterium]